MKTYNPDDFAHKFAYGKSVISLEALTPESLDDATAVLAAPRAELLKALLDFYEARTDKATFAKVRKLPLKLLFLEFRSWAGIEQAGVTPGESDGSPRE